MIVISIEKHSRVIQTEDEWLEYIDEFNYIDSVEHHGEPDYFPCVVATKFDFNEDIFYHKFFYKKLLSDLFSFDEEVWVHETKLADEDESDISFDWRDDFTDNEDDLDFSEEEK